MPDHDIPLIRVAGIHKNRVIRESYRAVCAGVESDVGCDRRAKRKRRNQRDDRGHPDAVFSPAHPSRPVSC